MSTHSVFVPPPSKPRMYLTETEYARNDRGKNGATVARFQKNSGSDVAGTYNPLRDADSSSRSGDCGDVPAGGDGARNAFPAAVAGCSRLFLGWADGALVGAGVFDCGHGDFDADDHWDAGDFLWRESNISATSPGVFNWPSTDCVVALARLLSRGVFNCVCAD